MWYNDMLPKRLGKTINFLKGGSIMPKYEVLSREVAEQIKKARQGAIFSPMAFDDEKVLRRQNLAKDVSTIWRPTFVHDIDKILHCSLFIKMMTSLVVVCTFSLFRALRVPLVPL